MRPALSALVLCALVLLDACGSGDSSSKKNEPGKSVSSSDSPSAAYFTPADTTAINKAAAPAQAAGAKAIARSKMMACNKFKDYPSWRACWHGLLDPFARGLANLAGAFKSLAAKDLPEDCVTELESATKTFKGFAAKVDGLLRGVDSDKAAAQAKAARTYSPTVTGISSGFAQPFRDMTQVCYSPKDLASINASPGASPSN